MNVRLEGMIEVIRGSLWEYVGHQVKYRGSRHMVLLVENEEDDTCVVTWAKTPAIAWLGDVTDFLKNFKSTTGTFSFL